MQRAACLLVLAAASVAPAASAAVIGPTPLAAALADTKKFAAHEVHAWNRPGVSYTVGTCRLFHRRPWVAYRCTWTLRGVPMECLDVITVGVKRLPDGTYRAEQLDTKILTSGPC